jgi:hypothetical protein
VMKRSDRSTRIIRSNLSGFVSLLSPLKRVSLFTVTEVFIPVGLTSYSVE